MSSNQNSYSDPLSVYDLTIAVKYKLQTSFNHLWVCGEVSGFSQPRSGHCYFTLKDDRAQINAIVWRSTAERLGFQIENGQSALCYGSLDVYPQRGTYQLIVDRIEPQGVGSLELAFRQLHAKLSKEGLFDPARKKRLPEYPKRVAVVTSPTGAAIRDFLQVIRRRWRDIEITIVPTKVQGPGAAEEIAACVHACQRFADPPEVIVVTRGGGSPEDLWSFNEEIVCRAIAQSNIPVISGVGHEVDVTLSDLAADVRALTPSEAAERLVPDRAEVVSMLESVKKRLSRALLAKLGKARAHLDSLAHRPVIARPLETIQRREIELDHFDQRMRRAIRNQVSTASRELRELAARLESLNPASVLARGYSLTTDDARSLVRNVEQLEVGDLIRTQLESGAVMSRVEKLEAE